MHLVGVTNTLIQLKIIPDKNQSTYVEVSFGYACNFKCMYCSSVISSAWMQEAQQHGGFSTTDNYNNIEWLEP